jgi:hypothetical protein
MSGTCEPGDEPVELCLIEIDRHHPCAGSGERARDRLTDPARRAGHDDPLAFESGAYAPGQ